MLITWFINNISISAITIINYISMVIAISAFVIAVVIITTRDL